jgi:hypothetical protein
MRDGKKRKKKETKRTKEWEEREKGEVKQEENIKQTNEQRTAFIVQRKYDVMEC